MFGRLVGAMKGEARVLSIQSHTVHGYVGNKSATFPMQVHGFDVDPVNSVHFSNHTGYNVVKGDVLHGQQLRDIVDGLASNNLLHHTHLLTGYIGSPSFLENVLYTLAQLRANNPDAVYVCDPVLGDYGVGMYVPEELVVPVASVLTPNQFEVEKLTDIAIKTERDAQRACALLHAAGPHTVVITSIEYDRDNVSREISCFASQQRPSGAVEQFHMSFPKHDGTFTGTGDLMAALLLVWTHKFSNNLPKALETTVASLQAVIRNTVQWAQHNSSKKAPATGKKSPPPELRLVQSLQDLLSPEVQYRAQRCNARVHGVVFDMDGTLTLPGQVDFAEMRHRLGIPEGVDVLHHIDALPTEGDRASALAQIDAVEVAAIKGGLKLRADVADVLGNLKRAGLRVGLLTLSGRPAVDAFCDVAGVPADLFDTVYTRADGRARKPHPCALQDICAEWQLDASSVLMVGDSHADMQCAVDAGCGACAVRSGHPDVEGMAGWVVDDLGELFGVLESIQARK